MKLVVSGRAGRQLDAIYDYSRQESEKFAAQLYNDILDEMEWLIAFPQMAPAEPMLDQEPETFRSLVVRRRYKVVYSIAGETVTIADVWDCRMDPEVLKKRTAKRK